MSRASNETVVGMCVLAPVGIVIGAAGSLR